MFRPLPRGTCTPATAVEATPKNGGASVGRQLQRGRRHSHRRAPQARGRRGMPLSTQFLGDWNALAKSGLSWRAQNADEHRMVAV